LNQRQAHGSIQSNIKNRKYMSILELIGTVAGFACVWLVVRQNIWNWPVGIVNNVLFLVLVAQNHLYANVGLQIVFIASGFYGWWKWLYGGANRTELPVSRLRRVYLAVYAAAWVVCAIGLAWLLQELAWRANIAPPDFVYWDSSITVASLLAQWMLTHKKIENWWVWIFAVNLSQFFLFAGKGLYLMAGLQIAYILLSLQGYLAWRKDLPELR
jgi:nicotinamide mononucleotide transporter